MDHKIKYFIFLVLKIKKKKKLKVKLKLFGKQTKSLDALKKYEKIKSTQKNALITVLKRKNSLLERLKLKNLMKQKLENYS